VTGCPEVQASAGLSLRVRASDAATGNSRITSRFKRTGNRLEAATTDSPRRRSLATFLAETPNKPTPPQASTSQHHPDQRRASPERHTGTAAHPRSTTSRSEAQRGTPRHPLPRSVAIPGVEGAQEHGQQCGDGLAVVDQAVADLEQQAEDELSGPRAGHGRKSGLELLTTQAIIAFIRTLVRHAVIEAQALPPKRGVEITSLYVTSGASAIHGQPKRQ
jgi:hypothetical protein